MNDGQRLYPVDEFILHHSMTQRFEGASDLEVQDAFSNFGRNRGYAGVDHSYHEHPSRAGVETFAQAQFAGIPDPTNKYNYRIVTLIARPWDNVAWHCGNWYHNQKSIGIENCGDFRYIVLEDRQLMCIADFYRPKDRELGGATAVYGHQEISATECPAQIMGQRDKLVDMINNPEKWNAILFPPAPPKPVITTKTITQTTPVPFSLVTTNDDTKISDTIVEGVEGVRTITYLVTYTDGKETKRVETSNAITTAPIDKKIIFGTYKPPVVVEPPVVVPPVIPPAPTLKTLWQTIVAIIMEWINKLKGGQK